MMLLLLTKIYFVCVVGTLKANDKWNRSLHNLQVQNLLQNVQDKFQSMSDQIITRIDDMGTRIDDLEKSIADLMTQAGVEGAEK